MGVTGPNEHDGGLDDLLALAYGRMRRLSDGDAEDWAVDAAARYCRGEVPDWMRSRNDRVRLDYVCVRVVLERRGTL